MKSYLQYLIWMMLFIIVIEMVFPDSAYRKYIKLVLGCILIYTMLSPIACYLRTHQGQGYEDYVLRYKNRLLDDEQLTKSYETSYNEQQENLQEVYEDSMKQYIEKRMGVAVENLWIDWQDGQIEELTLTVNPSNEQNEGFHLGDKAGTIYGEEEVLKNKLKTCLSDFYNVQVGNIHITVQKN